MDPQHPDDLVSGMFTRHCGGVKGGRLKGKGKKAG
jgi:hypothetical protein